MTQLRHENVLEKLCRGKLLLLTWVNQMPTEFVLYKTSVKEDEVPKSLLGSLFFSPSLKTYTLWCSSYWPVAWIECFWFPEGQGTFQCKTNSRIFSSLPLLFMTNPCFACLVFLNKMPQKWITNQTMDNQPMKSRNSNLKLNNSISPAINF